MGVVWYTIHWSFDGEDWYNVNAIFTVPRRYHNDRIFDVYAPHAVSVAARKPDGGDVYEFASAEEQQ